MGLYYGGKDPDDVRQVSCPPSPGDDEQPDQVHRERADALPGRLERQRRHGSATGGAQRSQLSGIGKGDRAAS